MAAYCAGHPLMHPYCEPEATEWETGICCCCASCDADGCVDCCFCACNVGCNPALSFTIAFLEHQENQGWQFSHESHPAVLAAEQKEEESGVERTYEQQLMLDTPQGMACAGFVLTTCCWPCCWWCPSLINLAANTDSDGRDQPGGHRTGVRTLFVPAIDVNVNCGDVCTGCCCCCCWPALFGTQIHRQLRLQRLIKHPACLVSISEALCCSRAHDADSFALASAEYKSLKQQMAGDRVTCRQFDQTSVTLPETMQLATLLKHLPYSAGSAAGSTQLLMGATDLVEGDQQICNCSSSLGCLGRHVAPAARRSAVV